MTRDEAIKIAVASAKLHRPSYYAEPFAPHEWVIDAVIAASVRRGRIDNGLVEYGSAQHQEMYTPTAMRLMAERDAAVCERDKARAEVVRLTAALENTQQANANYLRLGSAQNDALVERLAQAKREALTLNESTARIAAERAAAERDRERIRELLSAAIDRAEQAERDSNDSRKLVFASALSRYVALCQRDAAIADRDRLAAENATLRAELAEMKLRVMDVADERVVQAAMEWRATRHVPGVETVHEVNEDELADAVDAMQALRTPQVDDESRCAVCGWPLACSGEQWQGCVRGNCSQRPRPERLYAPERAAKEASRG